MGDLPANPLDQSSAKIQVLYGPWGNKPQRRVSGGEQRAHILADLLVVRSGFCVDLLHLRVSEKALDDDATVSLNDFDNILNGRRGRQGSNLGVLGLVGRVRHLGCLSVVKTDIDVK